MSSDDQLLGDIQLLGLVNRQNGLQAMLSVRAATGTPTRELIRYINAFPGLSRRFEKIMPNIYSDYAHNAEKVRGALDIALEHSKNVVVVYEGLHNRRQHFMRDQGQFLHLFDGAKKVYWVPSYLGREDPDLALLAPSELIQSMANPTIAEPAGMNDMLKKIIDTHAHDGDLVVCMSGGGGHSLDEWLRGVYKPSDESVNLSAA